MSKPSEQQRLLEISTPDRELWQQGAVLCGMDEVGRGPLAGPVVVGCVVMPPEPLLDYINDSKKVTQRRRELLYPMITATAIDYATAWVEPAVIDKINILEATRLAFREAFLKMKTPITDVLIDALNGVDIKAKQHILIHGDAKSYSIAAASILAKAERDRYMEKMDALYPQYGFASNKGYGTAQHIKAIREHGPCPIHRLSFIKNFL